MVDALEPQEFLGMPAVIRSEAMLQLLGLVKRIAQTSAVVLITGESGAGKELVARALHQYSLRCGKPWVDINCASLPEHLVESELFGYERGAFSGAFSSKQGLFELAHTGTLFLDEIGELDARMQVKLLRVLDGTSYYRLGGVRKISVDVRIIAATNKDLEREIEEGRFREDLYHRLNQVSLRVPPLRERPEDILAIAEFFLRQYDEACRLSADARAFLLRHAWPGNVRELRNVIANACILGEGAEIRASDMRPVRFHSTVQDCNLDEMERRLITQAIGATGGHQQRAAKLLGISQRTLSRKLRRLHEEPMEHDARAALACAV
jgi:DNA-binding NtrC family response regulator